MKSIQHYFPKLRLIDNFLSYGHAVKRLGYLPNLVQPKTFSENLLKRKFALNSSEKVRNVTDKEFVKTYLANRGKGNLLIPTIMLCKNTKELLEVELKGPLIVKPTHSSGNYKIFRNNLVRFNEDDLRLFDYWLIEDYYVRSRERNYRYLTPKLIIEPLLQTENGQLPMDFKVFCVNGIPKAIQVDVDRETNHKRAIYDTNWKKLPYSMYYEMYQNDLVRPGELELILDTAAELSSDFEFVRVDFYVMPEGIKFGEFTFFPGNCAEKFRPQSGDKDFGVLLFGGK